MDEDDQSAAEAHQMELEQREREELMLQEHGRLLRDFRKANAEWEDEMAELNERVDKLCKAQ